MKEPPHAMVPPSPAPLPVHRTQGREFETPFVSRAAPIALVGFLVLLVFVVFLTVSSSDRMAALNPYTLLALSGLVLLLVLHATRSPWRLLLHPQEAWIGSSRYGQSVPYETVRFLVAADASSTVAGRVARLTIETDRRIHGIELRWRDAEEAIEALRALCPHASGVTLSGRSFFPEDSAEAARGADRVRRVWIRRAVGWGSVSLFVVAGLALAWRRLPQESALSLCLILAFSLQQATRALLRARERSKVAASKDSDR
jgi:hypothetical protein